MQTSMRGPNTTAGDCSDFAESAEQNVTVPFSAAVVSGPLNAFLRTSCLLLILTFVGGCRSSDLPATSVVNGVVTYKGQPVKNGQVVFVPQGAGNSGRGVTDEQGHFTLSTYATGDGAVLGKHKVTVEVLENRNRAEPLHRARARSPIPLKYAEVNSTPLEIEIKADPNEVQFDLTD